MSDGFFEPINIEPDRETLHKKPRYSSSEDMKVAISTLNGRITMSESELGDKITKSNKSLRGDTGLIIKEPLS